MFYNNPVRLLALRSCLALYVVVVTVQSIVAGEWVLLILTSLFFLASLCYILTYLSMWHLDSIHLFSLHASFSCLWQLIDMVSHCSSIPRLRPCTWCWYSVFCFVVLNCWSTTCLFILSPSSYPSLFIPSYSFRFYTIWNYNLLMIVQIMLLCHTIADLGGFKVGAWASTWYFNLKKLVLSI